MVQRTPGSIQLWVEGAHSTDTADFNPPRALFGRQDPGSLRTDIANDNVTLVLNWFEELKQRVPTGR